ncbi:uncharacterized oxidoreductase YtbE isoform X1 [Hydra vulgaris]|uniref:uncharacterized oxidoreductase YtbE isoform X1 n=1 Tax=Hydra vulgaris TaxID=6087 RepID=UPI0006417621|nr:uncharacterized oxidoreductase YtbE [Hydra vulgaris]
MSLKPNKRTLICGNEIPMIGLGTFKLKNSVNSEEVYRVLDVAIESGYRLIDTASCYRNEEDIGFALEKLYVKHNIKRQDLFITSKLAPKDMGYDSAISTVAETLSKLKTTYLDLYLIHWPAKSNLSPVSTEHSGFRKETWNAFQYLFKQGSLKSIGVSNFTKKHLEELFLYADIPPSVNQVEFHPYLYQKELLEFCHKNNIFLQAYSSLGTGQLVKETLIQQLAQKYRTSAAQVLLKWALQQNVGVIPMSTSTDHIRSNILLNHFTINDDDMKLICQLDLQKHYCWDPTNVN